MAYDKQLATRVRNQVARAGAMEKSMFGGLAFMVNGNLSVGVRGDELVIRIPPDETDAALKEPGVRIFDLTGRPMRGWVMVRPDKPATVTRWVNRGLGFAASLPKKKAAKR
jgi:hypothetical protein